MSEKVRDHCLGCSGQGDDLRVGHKGVPRNVKANVANNELAHGLVYVWNDNIHGANRDVANGDLTVPADEIAVCLA